MSRTRDYALMLAVPAIIIATLAPPAAAAVPDQIRYNGASIHNATLPATAVPLEIWSSTPAAKIEVFRDGALVATDTTIEARDGYWLGTGGVDLTGLSGPSKLTMRVTPAGMVSRSVTKSFTVAPLLPVVQPVVAEAQPVTIAVQPVTVVEQPINVTVQADQIRWNGLSVHRAVLPGARQLPLEVWSSTAASKIELVAGGRVVATDATVEARPGYWLGAVAADLSALPAGSISLTMRVTELSGAVRTVAKTVTIDPVITPLTAEILALRPGPSNTGVPAGRVLTPSGSLRITQNGTVIDGLQIEGCVVVAADNVTIRNSRITCTTSLRKRAVSMEGTRTGLLLEDVEIDGRGVTDIGVDTPNTVIRRANIHHVNDGVRMGSNITVEKSWIHSMTRAGDLHPDAIQGISAQNVVIRGNTLDPRNLATGDLGNAAIMLGSESGTMLSRNVVIEGNYLNGGNCAVNVRGDINAQAYTVRTNRFGPDSRYCAVVVPATVPVAGDNVTDTWGTRVKVTAAA